MHKFQVIFNNFIIIFQMADSSTHHFDFSCRPPLDDEDGDVASVGDVDEEELLRLPEDQLGPGDSVEPVSPDMMGETYDFGASVPVSFPSEGVNSLVMSQVSHTSPGVASSVHLAGDGSSTFYAGPPSVRLTSPMCSISANTIPLFQQAVPIAVDSVERYISAAAAPTSATTASLSQLSGTSTDAAVLQSANVVDSALLPSGPVPASSAPVTLDQMSSSSQPVYSTSAGFLVQPELPPPQSVSTTLAVSVTTSSSPSVYEAGYKSCTATTVAALSTVAITTVSTIAGRSSSSSTVTVPAGGSVTSGHSIGGSINLGSANESGVLAPSVDASTLAVDEHPVDYSKDSGRVNKSAKIPPVPRPSSAARFSIVGVSRTASNMDVTESLSTKSSSAPGSKRPASSSPSIIRKRVVPPHLSPPAFQHDDDDDSSAASKVSGGDVATRANLGLHSVARYVLYTLNELLLPR